MSELKSLSINDEELDFINHYSRHPYSKDELYTFEIICCDNEIDRDYERFTVESLETLATMFVGKTGFLSETSVARIYQAWVQIGDKKKRNSLGDDYFQVRARAYIPYNLIDEEARNFLSQKCPEVSIGCAVAHTICSVCGKEITSCDCPHIKGKTYDGTFCYGELKSPTDVYEWSFVANPTEEINTRSKEMDNKTNAQEMCAEIAKRVRMILAFRNKTQSWLSKESGVSINAIGSLCNGTTSPRLVTVLAVANTLGVSFEYLLGKEPIESAFV